MNWKQRARRERQETENWRRVNQDKVRADWLETCKVCETYASGDTTWADYQEGVTFILGTHPTIDRRSLDANTQSQIISAAWKHYHG